MSPNKRRSKTAKNGVSTVPDENLEEIPQQTEEEKRRVRERIRKIKQRLDNISHQDHEEVKKLVEEVNKLGEKITGTQEAMEDAQMFNTLVKKVREMMEDTDINDQKFTTREFAAKLAERRGVTSQKLDYFSFSKRNWIDMGEYISSHYLTSPRTPTIKFVAGAINTEKPDDSGKAGETKERRRAPREKVALATRTVTAVDKVDKGLASEAKTDKLVKITMKCLEEECRARNVKHLCYFTFVIDPDSFGRTVENMFHVSFLVKQRAVILFVGENGLPQLEPLTSRQQKQAELAEEDSNIDQAVMTIDMEDWRQLKENLAITSKCIEFE